VSGERDVSQVAYFQAMSCPKLKLQQKRLLILTHSRWDALGYSLKSDARQREPRPIFGVIITSVGLRCWFQGRTAHTKESSIHKTVDCRIHSFWNFGKSPEVPPCWGGGSWATSTTAVNSTYWDLILARPRQLFHAPRTAWVELLGSLD
jgi:hypothetical protein